MSGATQGNRERWILGLRYIENQIDRAEFRSTLTYRIVPRLSVGIEYNPLANDVSGLANFLAVEETDTRPALMFGTSSDRIGTSHGQAFYGTLSKDLERWIQLPIAPYVGASYGTFDHKLRAIGGTNIRLSKKAGALIIYDGVHVHPTFSWTEGQHVFTLLLVEGEHFGLAYNFSFDFP